jgi:hypothetical protein
MFTFDDTLSSNPKPICIQFEQSVFGVHLLLLTYERASEKCVLISRVTVKQISINRVTYLFHMSLNIIYRQRMNKQALLMLDL